MDDFPSTFYLCMDVCGPGHIHIIFRDTCNTHNTHEGMMTMEYRYMYVEYMYLHMIMRCKLNPSTHYGTCGKRVVPMGRDALNLIMSIIIGPC